MVNAGGQATVRADEEEESRACVSVFTPVRKDERVLRQRRLKGTHGATVGAVQGYSGDRRELAFAANGGAVIDGMLSNLLAIGNNINIIGLKTAQTFER
eukprot:9502809-Pyramimonas_sp.AAC.1